MVPKQSQPGQFPEWMDLKAIQQYACVSERTIRDWIHRPLNPLPAVQVDRGKILVRRTQFDRWLEAHPFQSLDSVDVAGVADEIFNQIRKAA